MLWMARGVAVVGRWENVEVNGNKCGDDVLRAAKGFES